MYGGAGSYPSQYLGQADDEDEDQEVKPSATVPNPNEPGVG